MRLIKNEIFEHYPNAALIFYRRTTRDLMKRISEMWTSLAVVALVWAGRA